MPALRLLKLVPGWAWMALAAALAVGAGWLRLEHVTAERDAAHARLETSRGEVAALESALEWRRENARKLRDALDRREQALAEARKTIQAHRAALAQLESTDAETGEWVAQPVPDAVSGWLRQLRNTDGTDSGDADDTAQFDDTTSPADRKGRQQSRPTGAAR
ncbi:MAG: hypothetical protein ACQEUG_15950 [Pseudomonadota bacterium]